MLDKDTVRRSVKIALHKSVFGIMIAACAGFVFSVLGSSYEWLFHPPFEPSLTRILFDMRGQILVNILFISAPIAASIGFIIGLCSPASRNFHFPQFIWQCMTSLSTIAAFWLSGFNELSHARFLLLVLVVSFLTSWLVNRSLLQESYKPNGNPRRIFNAISSISGLIVLFVINYLYFRFQFFLLNVSS